MPFSCRKYRKKHWMFDCPRFLTESLDFESGEEERELGKLFREE